MGILNRDEAHVRKVLLEQFAMKGTGTTYGQLMKRTTLDLGPHDRRFHDMLGQISAYEEERGRGLLSALVGRQDSMICDTPRLWRPGNGFFKLAAKLDRSVPTRREDRDVWAYKEQQQVLEYWKDRQFME